MLTSSVFASVVRKSQSCACPVASLPAPNEYLSIFRVLRPLIGPSGSVSCVVFSSRFLRALLSLPSLGKLTIQPQCVRSPLRCCQCRLCAQQWTEEDTAEETHPCLREFTGNILCKTFLGFLFPLGCSFNNYSSFFVFVWESVNFTEVRTHRLDRGEYDGGDCDCCVEDGGWWVIFTLRFYDCLLNEANRIQFRHWQITWNYITAFMASHLMSPQS